MREFNLKLTAFFIVFVGAIAIISSCSSDLTVHPDEGDAPTAEHYRSLEVVEAVSGKGESTAGRELIGEGINRPAERRPEAERTGTDGDGGEERGESGDSTVPLDRFEPNGGDTERAAEAEVGCGQTSQSQTGRMVELPLGASEKSLSWDGCRALNFRTVAAKGVQLRFEIRGLSPLESFSLEVYGPKVIYTKAREKPWASGNSNSKSWLSVTVKVRQSGELFGVLKKLAGTKQTLVLKARVVCTGNCHLETTRYPVVLLHGFAGTDKYFGLLDYFYKVRSHLEKKGYLVFTPTVQPIADSKVRVNRLAGKIDQILRQTGAKKLNLIAHSQGGVDGRLLISRLGYGAKIATLTTISSPHRGIPLPQLLVPPAQELSEKNMKVYNQRYPNDPRVKYFSWAGVTCSRLDFKCRKKYKDEVVDPLLSATYLALKALRGPNDGVVPVSSAKWGTFLGELPADHWDEIGQVADEKNRPFRHLDFYLSEVRRLRGLGY